MRLCLLAFVLTAAVPAVLARKDRTTGQLYYFTSCNRVGVKDGNGRIVVPANNYNFSEYKAGQPVKEALIYMMPVHDTAEPHTMGAVYSRKGELQYRPFAYDNGADYRSEGMSRFVEKGKVGFVNRIGEKAIPARYDYAEPFNYGITAYCNGCTWKLVDEEHQAVSGGTWGYINASGKDVGRAGKRASFKDQQIDSVTFIPYPFSYTPAEQSILSFFQKQPLIAKSYFVNHFSPLDSAERQVYYEIVERPSSYFPYYHVKGFTLSNEVFYSNELLDEELNFFVTKDGNTIYGLREEKKLPFAQWLKSYVAEARQYSKTHPDAPYKF